MFLSRLKQKFCRARRKEIPLHLLSRLWIEKEMHEKSFLKNSITSKWAHDDINQFYAQYIAPNIAVLGAAASVIDHILSLLDDAGTCPFSEETSIEIEIEDDGFPVVTLREHSLNVARIAVDMIKKNHRDYDMILGKTLIICLGHGLGALSSAQTIGGLIAKTLLILYPLIQDLPFKQDIVLALLTFGENHPRTDGAKILKAASFAARRNEQERNMVLSKINHPDVLDIQKIRAAIQLSQGK
jgi:hypothetical protein